MRSRPASPARTHVHVEALLAAADEGLDRRQGDGRVVALVRAVQRQEQVVVVPAEPAHRQLLPADRDIAGEDAEVVALEGERGLDLPAALQQDLGDVGLLQPDDRDRAGLDDPALLGGDVLHRAAEEPLVVDRDRA